MRALLERRLAVVTGKGGTGKSTLSAALALSAARQGKKTLVCEVVARERVSALVSGAFAVTGLLLASLGLYGLLAFIVAERAENLAGGVALAANAIDGGLARTTLRKLVKVSNS